MTSAATAELIAAAAASAAKATVAHLSARTPSTPRATAKPPSTPKLPKPPKRALTDRDRELLAVAIHEAGHAVAAVVLGAQLRNAVVASGRVTGPEGLTTLMPGGLPHGRGPEFAFAGPWAQARFLAGGRPSFAQLHAVFDHHGHKDRRVLVAAGGLHEGSGVTFQLERAWPAVLTCARRLYTAGEAHHDDVCKALGLTDGGGPGSVQLANLRAGLRTVPTFVPATKQAAPA
ncbi:hypothetical protein [Mycobacterium sp. 141]|uniref:hypothetical protein n=1 Tax=Mycobacterium sp. 141 TaxID=1120797 RepID=UPI00036ED7C7|nr:hypothetical protein [Mycobacterium sp. 141]